MSEGYRDDPEFGDEARWSVRLFLLVLAVYAALLLLPIWVRGQYHRAFAPRKIHRLCPGAEPSSEPPGLLASRGPSRLRHGAASSLIGIKEHAPCLVIKLARAAMYGRHCRCHDGRGSARNRCAWQSPFRSGGQGHADARVWPRSKVSSCGPHRITGRGLRRHARDLRPVLSHARYRAAWRPDRCRRPHCITARGGLRRLISIICHRFCSRTCCSARSNSLRYDPDTCRRKTS